LERATLIAAPARPRELQGRKAVWRVAGPLDGDLAAQVHGTSRMIAHLLYERGFQTPAAMDAFLNGPAPEHDPLLMPDMTAAATRIRSAAAAGERIAVYGDFDCDGLTASAILLETVRILGSEPVVVIPTRDEGHGMREELLRELASQRTSLVISADCGIGDVRAVAAARSLGMEVIVTDHHEPAPDGTLPDALVVSPTRIDSLYPWRYLSGAGVAYKVAQAVLETPGRYEQLLDLAAFGTIADVVSLRDENRTLVVKGLEMLRNTNRCGLRALFSVSGISAKHLDSVSVGYYLGPRVNAANRIDDPRLAFDLITASDPARANQLALRLDAHNSTRQEKVKDAIADAVQRVGLPTVAKAAMRAGDRDPIVCVSGDWKPGISGLLASELSERYCVPALAASPRSDGLVSASGRSVKGVDVLEILNSAREERPDLFLGGGGHALACGFTTAPELLEAAFFQLGLSARGRVPTEELTNAIAVDAQVKLGQIDMRSLGLVESLGPYGSDFPEPVFLATGIRLSSRRRMGASGQHLKMTAKDGNAKVSAIVFSSDPELAEVPEDRRLDVVFSLQRDFYDGLVRPQIHIKDWRPHDA